MTDLLDARCPDCEASLRSPLDYVFHKCVGGESKFLAMTKDMAADGSLSQMARDWEGTSGD